MGLGRSVHRSFGSLPRRAGTPATGGAPRTPRRGTSSAFAIKRMHSTRRPTSHRASRTRPSLGPRIRARRSSLHFGVARRRRWRVRGGIAVGQARESENNRHRGLRERTERGSPRVTASARKVVRDASEKEGDCGLRPCEVRELGSQCPYVAVKAVAEVTRRRSVSNKLARSAPKRATARVNGDLARCGRRR